MRNLATLCLTMIVTLACAPPAQQESTDVTADVELLTAKTQAWADAFNAGDAAGIAALYAEDGTLYPPNAAPVQGRTAIQEFWQGFIDTGVKAELETLDVQVDGDLSYEVGAFTDLAPDGSEVDDGNYIVAWRRVDGEWWFQHDIWNSNRPLEPPMEEEGGDEE